MTGPSRPELPDRADGARRASPRGEALQPRGGPAGAGPAGSWWAWVRAHPALALAVPVFCIASLVGLTLSIPPGMMSAGRSSRVTDVGPPSALRSEPSARPAPKPAGPVETPPAARKPVAPDPPEAPAEAPADKGPWVRSSPSPASPRGLALVYAYRTLPPGGDSRFEWYVRLQGARSLLDDVDMVLWRMDPPPNNDGELVSRNRANDGFPLMGDGPGGWFGVAATVRYKDGNEETLSRRVEMPD
jgi:hypothetical protein